jgi:hypothetical protein
MRELSDTMIDASLSAEEVRQLAVRYVEAWSDGWRPPIYIASDLEALYEKCKKLTRSKITT